MIRLCRKGAKQSLEIADLYKPLSIDESARLTDALEKNWKAEVDRCQFKIEGGPSLTRAIAKTFFGNISDLEFYCFYNLLFVLHNRLF